AELVGQSCQDGVGIVGARLWYPNGTIQHCGVITGIGGVAAHAFRGLDKNTIGYFGRSALQQSISAVTGACIVLRRNIFEEAGRFEETLPIALSDIDICLKIIGLGYRNIFNPYSELIHYESLTRGYDDVFEKQGRAAYEIVEFRRRWGARLVKDPSYNSQLSLFLTDFSLGSMCIQTRFNIIGAEDTDWLMNLLFMDVRQKKDNAFNFIISEYSRMEAETRKARQLFNRLRQDQAEIRNNLKYIRDELESHAGLINNIDSIITYKILNRVTIM
ncbi:glycosyltransferase family 2 protein, partial [Acidithiobacillus caldus]|uniref:glycosyltransferase family 2 protein n=1 Tax=Acidithiobacillus caldus TaxID=33059 RepID=UPI000ACA27AC